MFLQFDRACSRQKQALPLFKVIFKTIVSLNQVQSLLAGFAVVLSFVLSCFLFLFNVFPRLFFICCCRFVIGFAKVVQGWLQVLINLFKVLN